MADINIERKKKSPLPWMLGLAVLALLAFLLMRGRGADDANEPAAPVTDTVTAVDATTGAAAAPGTAAP